MDRWSHQLFVHPCDLTMWRTHHMHGLHQHLRIHDLAVCQAWATLIALPANGPGIEHTTTEVRHES